MTYIIYIYIYKYILYISIDDRFVCLAPCFAWCFPTPQGAWKDGPAARFVVDGYPRSEEQLRSGTGTEPIRFFFFFRKIRFLQVIKVSWRFSISSCGIIDCDFFVCFPCHDLWGSMYLIGGTHEHSCNGGIFMEISLPWCLKGGPSLCQFNHDPSWHQPTFHRPCQGLSSRIEQQSAALVLYQPWGHSCHAMGAHQINIGCRTREF